MGIRVEIKDGTTSDTHLCSSCSHGMEAEMDNGRKIRKCKTMGVTIPRPVVRCQMYQDKGIVDNRVKMDLAWSAVATKEGMRFFSPDQLSDLEEEGRIRYSLRGPARLVEKREE